MEAVAIWRKYPRQIASDLKRFFHTDIEDWHQGRLSSYKLLEWFGATITDDEDNKVRTIVVEFAPENGALAKALRDGGFSRFEEMVAETHNEIARLRTSFHVVNGGESYEPPEFVDPRVEKLRAEAKQQREQFHQEAEEALFKDFDW